jgi:hypothetical protein
VAFHVIDGVPRDGTTFRRGRALTAEKEDLARQVDAAQSILSTPAARVARRLERALAACNRAVAAAMARTDPASGAGAIDMGGGGVAIFAGKGSPLTQGLAMGTDGPVTAADLDAMEAHVCPDGEGSKQLELCPYADPSLAALLALRGYRVHEWQLVWEREVPVEPMAPPPPELTIRRVRPGEEELFFRVVMAGKLDALVRSDEFQEILTVAQLILDGVGVTHGDTGEAVARQIQRLQKHL